MDLTLGSSGADPLNSFTPAPFHLPCNSKPLTGSDPHDSHSLKSCNLNSGSGRPTILGKFITVSCRRALASAGPREAQRAFVGMTDGRPEAV